MIGTNCHMSLISTGNANWSTISRRGGEVWYCQLCISMPNVLLQAKCEQCLWLPSGKSDLNNDACNPVTNRKILMNKRLHPPRWALWYGAVQAHNTKNECGCFLGPQIHVPKDALICRAWWYARIITIRALQCEFWINFLSHMCIHLVFFIIQIWSPGKSLRSFDATEDASNGSPGWRLPAL